MNPRPSIVPHLATLYDETPSRVPLRIFPRCYFFFPLSSFLFRKQSVIRSVTRVAVHLLIGFGLSIILFMARTWLAHCRNVVTNNKKRHEEKKDKRKAFTGRERDVCENYDSRT